MNQTIIAERRILVYEDYKLAYDMVSEFLHTPEEDKAFASISDVKVTWDEGGGPFTLVTFRSPSGEEYEAFAFPPFSKCPLWDIEIKSLATDKYIWNGETFCKLEDGTQVIINDVASVVIAVATYLRECEEAGYPDFDEDE